MQFIDSHCHLHDKQFYPDNQEDVYDRARAQNVSMIVVGTDEKDSRAAVDFARSHADVWAVVGVHPHDTKNGYREVGRLLGECASEQTAKIVGIGEIGLDYFYSHSPRNVQIKALEEQLAWAQDYDLPVSFHVREAFEDFWPIVNNLPSLRGVLHSFTDTAATLEKALARGFYVGINGISTFTKDAAQAEMFASIPQERMLLETDAPFLTPVPLRGRVNEPAYVRAVAEFQATKRAQEVAEIAEATTQNTRELFAL